MSPAETVKLKFTLELPAEYHLVSRLGRRLLPLKRRGYQEVVAFLYPGRAALHLWVARQNGWYREYYISSLEDGMFLF